MQAGFTLMEVLVSLAIFSTISVAVTDIFLISTRAERRIGSEEELSGTARSAMERVVRTVRTGALDYGQMTVTPGVPLAALRVLDAAGTSYGFSASSDVGLCGASPTPCLLITEAGVSAPLTPAGITVSDLKFFVTPAADPFVFDPATGSYAADAQPTVTVVLALTRPTGVAVRLQTTVTTRQYVR